MTEKDLKEIEARIGVTKKNLHYIKMREAKAGATWVIEDIERLIAEVRRLSSYIEGAKLASMRGRVFVAVCVSCFSCGSPFFLHLTDDKAERGIDECAACGKKVDVA